MQQTFYLKRDDTSPVLQLLLETSADLTGASCVFNMSTPAGVMVVDAEPATVILPSTVIYAWVPADTAAPGTFRADFTVTYSNGRTETFPNAGFIDVIISPGAAAP